MTGKQARARRRGTSLIELMVAIGVTSIVIAGAFLVMNEGLQLYRTNKRAADVQIEVLQILTRITTEAVNAKKELVRPYPESGGGIPGVVFASPLMDDGSVRTDDDTGEVYWQKWVCYYFVEGDPAGTPGKLYRAEQSIEPSGPGSKDLALVVDGLDDYNTDHFRDTTTLPRRLLAGDVSGFVVKTYEGDITSTVVTGTSTAAHTAYDIAVEAGDRTNRGAAGYFIKVDSRVTPRG